MIPSRRTYGLLLAGIAIAPLLAWGGPETRLSSATLLMLLFDGVILGLMAIDHRRVKSCQLDVSREVLPRLSVGRENTVTLKVQASTDTEFQIRDDYPAGFDATPPLVQGKLAAQQSAQLTYTVRPPQRGEFDWGTIQVRQLSPWGLAWADWKIPQPQTVSVYPDLIGLRALSIRLTLQSTGAMRQARRLGMGTEFAELREYSVGDDPRLVDWKITARYNRPLIRVLEPEQEQTLLILLDRGRLMTARVAGLKRFDWGLNATLALALAAVSRGDRVGVAVFDRQIYRWIPPERGQRQFNKLLEQLTPIQPDLLEPDYFGTVSTLVSRQTRRALVVLITDIVDSTASSELMAAMSRLAPRYLPLCVTLRDPEVDRQAHAQTDAIASTYARAVALDLLAQRQAAFAQLQQKGTMVLDAPANRISEPLVDHYLRLKARGQL